MPPDLPMGQLLCCWRRSRVADQETEGSFSAGLLSSIDDGRELSTPADDHPPGPTAGPLTGPTNTPPSGPSGKPSVNQPLTAPEAADPLGHFLATFEDTLTIEPDKPSDEPEGTASDLTQYSYEDIEI
jgi:hypothetical protein